MPGAGLSLTLEGLVDVERRLARLPTSWAT